MSDDTCMRAGLAYAKVCTQLIAVMGDGCVMTVVGGCMCDSSGWVCDDSGWGVRLAF